MRFGDRWLSRIEQAWSPAITHTDSTTVSAHALGDLGREATGSHRSPARGRDPDERLVLVGHSLLVLVPVWMFAGDGTEVVDKRLSGFRHVEHLGRAVHLHPGPVEVVGEHADAHLGVAAGIARLRPPRVRRHHDAALLVHATAHRGKLWPPVTARGHVDPLGRGRRKSRSSSRETVSTVATLGMPAILTPCCPRPTPNSPGLIRVARVPAGSALGDKVRYPRLYAYT